MFTLFRLGLFGLALAGAVIAPSFALLALCIELIGETIADRALMVPDRALGDRLARSVATLLLLPAAAALWLVWKARHGAWAPDSALIWIIGGTALAVQLIDRAAAGRRERGAASAPLYPPLFVLAVGAIAASPWNALWPDVLAGLAIACSGIVATRHRTGRRNVR